jgi:hypothetical protein
MKVAIVFLLVALSCSTLGHTESGTEIQIERIEAVAERIESGKLIDKKEIAEELRSCKGLVQANHEALVLCRAENQKLISDNQSLAEAAGRGKMIEWLYWAIIGAFALWNLIGFLKRRAIL